MHFVLGAAQMKQRWGFPHCLSNAFDATVYVRIEEGEKSAEAILDRPRAERGRHQEEEIDRSSD